MHKKIKFELVEDGTVSGDLGSFDGPAVGMGVGGQAEPYISKMYKKKKKKGKPVKEDYKKWSPSINKYKKAPEGWAEKIEEEWNTLVSISTQVAKELGVAPPKTSTHGRSGSRYIRFEGLPSIRYADHDALINPFIGNLVDFRHGAISDAEKRIRYMFDLHSDIKSVDDYNTLSDHSNEVDYKKRYPTVFGDSSEISERVKSFNSIRSLFED